MSARRALRFGQTALALFLVSGSARGVAPPDERPRDARDLLARIQKAYAKSPSVTVSFVQTYAPAGFAETAPETGRLTLQAPSQLRFDYDGKEGKLFTFDGKAARQYVAQDRQLVLKTLSAEERARLPLLFLEEPEALLTRYEVVFRAADNGLYEAALTPRAGQEPKKLVLLASAGGEVKRLVITDRADNRTTFTFTQRQAGKGRPASDFTLVPPPGTRIVSDETR